jgi:hypothetical protein
VLIEPFGDQRRNHYYVTAGRHVLKLDGLANPPHGLGSHFGGGIVTHKVHADIAEAGPCLYRIWDSSC